MFQFPQWLRGATYSFTVNPTFHTMQNQVCKTDVSVNQGNSFHLGVLLILHRHLHWIPSVITGRWVVIQDVQPGSFRGPAATVLCVLWPSGLCFLNANPLTFQAEDPKIQVSKGLLVLSPVSSHLHKHFFPTTMQPIHPFWYLLQVVKKVFDSHQNNNNIDHRVWRSVQGQVGWSFEQPALVEGVPAHGRGVGMRWSLRCLPTQTIPWFHEQHCFVALRNTAMLTMDVW